MPRPADDDATIKLVKRVPAARRAPRVPIWAIALPALFAVLAGAGVWLIRPSSPPPEPSRQIAVQPVIAPRPPPERTQEAPSAAIPTGAAAFAEVAPPAPQTQPHPPDFKIETATEQHILGHVPADPAKDLSVFRFAPNPRILVLDFTSLRDQGRMLNRTAALVEKSGLPRNRLLSDTELDAAIHASGDTVETFYYGHDYAAASMVRFFALADRDNVRLLDDEEALRRLIRQEGWFEPNVQAALISIPQAGINQRVSLAARAAILHHELSHGEYFTNPAYAAFVHRFWTQTLTSAERDRVRARLHTLGYDPGLDDVMENEAQAYLMFTDSAEFFTPDMFGMSRARLAELRNGFYRAMPAGWLRESLGQDLTSGKTPTSTHQSPGAP